jgi:hypothetical protein
MGYDGEGSQACEFTWITTGHCPEGRSFAGQARLIYCEFLSHLFPFHRWLASSSGCLGMVAPICAHISDIMHHVLARAAGKL